MNDSLWSINYGLSMALIVWPILYDPYSMGHLGRTFCLGCSRYTGKVPDDKYRPVELKANVKGPILAILTLLWAWENDLRKFDLRKFHADSRYLPVLQKIALASFYPLHKKSRRSQSLNELYNHFCEFSKVIFSRPQKSQSGPEWPKWVLLH